MKRENLVQKLGRKISGKVLPYVMVGALVFGGLSAHYRCSNFVEPEPEKPKAVLTATPDTGVAPLEVLLNGGDSSAPEGSIIIRYEWNRGYGSTYSTLSDQTNVGYPTSGEYNASLIVIDDKGGRSAKALKKIVVSENILGKIAFRGSPPDYRQDIYSGDIIHRAKDDKIELRNINRLTTYPEADWEPAWSPDGSQIAFTTNHEDVDGDGGEDISIYIMNSDGSNPRRLTPNIELAKSPYWCADNKIVFTFVNYGSMGVASINPDGTNYTELFLEPGNSFTPWAYPTCSPDGSKIAFGTNQDGNWEIYTMNADGGELKRLTNNSAIDVHPVFLPNCSKIIFTSNRVNTSEFDLYSINPNGTNTGQLTYAIGTETEPDISQDGKYVIFTHFVGVTERPQLYLTELINANDSTKWIQLTTEGGNNFPSWKPEIKD